MNNILDLFYFFAVVIYIDLRNILFFKETVCMFFYWVLCVEKLLLSYNPDSCIYYLYISSGSKNCFVLEEN